MKCDEEMGLKPPHEEEEEEEEFKKMIQATTNDVIESDKKELMELFTELKEKVPDNCVGNVLQLEKLINAFVTYFPDDY